MKVTYKVVRFGNWEKSGSKPFNSLFSSTLHNTEQNTRWKNEIKCNQDRGLILYTCDDHREYNYIVYYFEP